MKKAAIFGLALLLVAGISTIVFAHGPGYGRGYGGGQGYGMGPGAMHGGYGGGNGGGEGYGMGPGAMHGGYGMMEPGWGGRDGNQTYWESENREPSEEVTKEDAETFFEDRLAYWRNPNLKLGKIVEKDNYFEGEIVTKKGNSVVQKLQIEKKTGLVRPVF